MQDTIPVQASGAHACYSAHPGLLPQSDSAQTNGHDQVNDGQVEF